MTNRNDYAGAKKEPGGEQPYWLCCGSTDPMHADRQAKGCMEAKMGHPERCRWGTKTDHASGVVVPDDETFCTGKSKP